MRIYLLFSLLILSACDATSESTKINNVSTEMHIDALACDRAAAKQHLSNTESVQCKFGKFRLLLDRANYTHDDLVDQWQRRYELTASKIDAGEISKAEGFGLYQNADHDFFASTARRDQADLEALDAISGQMSGPTNNMRPISAPAITTPLHCMSSQFHNSVNTTCY